VPNLVVVFNGMVLVGDGQSRSEAWLVDTAQIVVGTHQHRHELRLEDNRQAALDHGRLIWFEDADVRLSGPVDLSAALPHVVDLNGLRDDAPVLRDELLDTNPAPGGPWTKIMASWVRLPGGVARATADPRPAWPFAKDPARALCERLTLTRADVQSPVLCIQTAESTFRFPIPFEDERFRVTITTRFVGEEVPRPELGATVALDELGLLYGCLTNPQGEIPARAFTQQDLDSLLPGFTHDPTICPPGRIRIG
jgi:hypothetical protein